MKTCSSWICFVDMLHVHSLLFKRLWCAQLCISTNICRKAHAMMLLSGSYIQTWANYSALYNHKQLQKFHIHREYKTRRYCEDHVRSLSCQEQAAVCKPCRASCGRPFVRRLGLYRVLHVSFPLVKCPMVSEWGQEWHVVDDLSSCTYSC